MQSAQLMGGAKTFADEIMEKVRTARATRGVSTLAQDIGTTTGQLASEGAALRERTMNVNPIDVDKMLASQRGATLGALTTQSQFAEERAGTMAETLDKGANQLTAQALIKQAEADIAKTEAANLIDLLELQAKISTGSKPPTALLKPISEYNSIASLLNGMKTAITSLKGKTGIAKGVFSELAGRLGLDIDIRTYQDLRNVYVSAFSKGVGKETGVLTDQDIARAKQAMPSLYDPPEELARKEKELNRILQDSKYNVMQLFDYMGVPFEEKYLLPTGQTSSTMESFMQGSSTTGTKLPLTSFEE